MELQSSVQLDITTLLHGAAPGSGISQSDHLGNRDGLIIQNLVDQSQFGPYEHLRNTKQQDRFSLSEDREYLGREDSSKAVVVKGSDAGDFPTEYSVTGLNLDDIPVIGVYVDRKILPGFKYRVRVLGQNQSLFQGRALRLQSIGRGYGKRITFESPTLNENSNYFYSDTNPAGYGFRLTALEPGDAFVVLSRSGELAGEGKIREVALQRETNSTVDGETVTKHVAVHFTCDVKYGAGKHGLLTMCSENTLELQGTAIVVKAKRGAKAETRSVEHVLLPNYGECMLVMTGCC